MKTILSLGAAVLSIATLHAADPQPPATDAQNPAPPPTEARQWGHGPGHDKMMRGGKPGWGRGDMKRGDWKGRGGMDRGPKGFCAQGPKDKGRAMGHPFADALQLTDAQKAKAKELMEAAKPKIEAIREEERAKIKAVMEESMKGLRDSLTPEQQAVFDDLQKLRTDREALKPAKPEAADKSTPAAKSE